jgi:hypothetical protein
MAIQEPLLQCAAHFSACAATAKASHPSMTFYPLYLVLTVVEAVLFQERCFVPLRTAIRRAFLKHDRRYGERAGLAKL